MVENYANDSLLSMESDDLQPFRNFWQGSEERKRAGAGDEAKGRGRRRRAIFRDSFGAEWSNPARVVRLEIGGGETGPASP